MQTTQLYLLLGIATLLVLILMFTIMGILLFKDDLVLKHKSHRKSKITHWGK